MNKLVPLGVGIAAVAVAVLVGGQLIASPAPEGVGAVPSVEPSPTPTPTATAARRLRYARVAGVRWDAHADVHGACGLAWVRRRDHLPGRR